MNRIKKYHNLVLRNIDLSEIQTFYDQLDIEKKYMANPLKYPLEFVVGIKENGNIIGIGGLKKYFHFFHFLFCIIKVEYQGKGLGKQITFEIINYAREKSYSCVFITANKENVASVEVMVKTGFKIVFESDIFYRTCLPLNLKGKFLTRLMPIVFKVYFVLLKLLRKREKCTEY